MSSKFIVSNRVHDPPRDFTSVPACTYIDSSGQEFIDMETHQMDIDARDAAYRQEVHNQLVRQQSDPAQKAELKAFLAEFYHFDNFGFDVDIYKRPLRNGFRTTLDQSGDYSRPAMISKQLL